MFKPGLLEYKCRRCGEISSSIHAPDVNMALLAIMNDWDINKLGWTGMMVHKTEPHHCKDGGFGVSDLIGGVEDKEETK